MLTCHMFCRGFAQRAKAVGEAAAAYIINRLQSMAYYVAQCPRNTYAFMSKIANSLLGQSSR